MPKKTAGKAASPLHSALLLRLRRLFETHELTIKAGMEKAGLSEQLYNQWQNGSSPRLETLEQIAKAYEVAVPELLGGLRGMLTPESAEIASSIDDLPEAVRTAIARSAQAQAMLYRAGAVQPPRPAK